VAEKLWSAEWKRLRLAFAASLPVRCEVCGEMVQLGQPWDLDHRIPRSKGGANHPSNLRPLHRRCNRLPSRRLAWESKERRRREAEANASRRRLVESISINRRTSIPPVAPVPPVESVEKSRIF
jgi:5-methylcytosine-specific restriction endonuclease McrA